MQWAEGMIFKAFLTEDRIPAMSEMPILTRDEYLGGLLDFTGELNRYAVMRATERNIAAVKKCRDVVDTLMGIFLEVRPIHLLSLVTCLVLDMRVVQPHLACL
jgi:predicted translin family RNA/ssDNA-binding protein